MKQRRLTIDVDYLAGSYGANDSCVYTLEYDDYGNVTLILFWVEPE